MEMTLMITYFLLVFILPLSLYLIFFIHKKSFDNAKNLPPGSNGWPVLGENIELALSGFPKFIRDKMEKHSHQVFKTSMLGEQFVIPCGAQGNKFVFNNHKKLVIPWFPVSIQKVLLPDYEETSLKGSESILLNHFHFNTLKPEALKEFVPVMVSLARKQLENEWRPNTVVKVLPLIRTYTFDLSCRLFLNVMDPKSVSSLLHPFTVLSKGMLSLPIDLPGTPYNRAIKASKTMRVEMMTIIRQKRKDAMEKTEEEKAKAKEKKDKGNDLLSKLLTLTDEYEEYMSDEKMSNLFLGMLMASFDTTASALTAVIYFLAQLPHIYQQVLKEQMDIANSKGPDEELTWEDFEKMNYSKNVVNESLRLAPPAPGGFREATNECNYAGFTIPKGCKVMWSPHSSHKNPDYFPEPEKFDPSRFEGVGPAPYTYVPFGGGPTICPGRSYAKLAILVFIHNLVTRFRVEKAIPNEEILFHGAWPTPAHGLSLRLLPHPNHSIISPTSLSL